MATASTIRSRGTANSLPSGVAFNSPQSYTRETGARVDSTASKARGVNVRPERAALVLPPEMAEGLRLTRLDRSAVFDAPDDSAIVDVGEYLAAVVSDFRATIGEDSEVAAIMRSKLEIDFYKHIAIGTAIKVAEQIARQCSIVVRTKTKTVTHADKPRFYRMDNTRKRRG